MFRLETTASFSAAHAIMIAGWREPLHGHDWHVTVTVEGPRLDADGLLVDFHALEGHLAQVIGPFRNGNLNERPPFSGGLNPTAENVARWIAESLSARLQIEAAGKPKMKHAVRPPNAKAGRPAVQIASVRVTEAIGCAAVYIPTPAERPATPVRAARKKTR